MKHYNYIIALDGGIMDDFDIEDLRVIALTLQSTHHHIRQLIRRASAHARTCGCHSGSRQ